MPVFFKKILSLLIFFSLSNEIQSQHFNFRNYSVEDGLPQSQVLSMIQDNNGYLWLGTYGGGISKFDGRTFENLSKKNGLSDNIVSAVYEDKAGNIWMGMGNNEGGVCMYDGKHFKTLTTKDGLSNNKVFSIVQDEDGNMWFGTDSGLNKYDGTKIEVFSSEKGGLLHDRIRSAFKDSKGKIWFGTDSGIMEYEKGKFKNIPIYVKGNLSIIWSVKEDHKGNIWFAIFMGGVGKYDGHNITLLSETDGLPSNAVYSICEDADGNMWFGTDSKGACKFDGKNFINYTIAQGLPNNRIREIIRDRENNIWFATDDGLSRYNGLAFTSYTVKDGLPNNIVNAIFTDSKKNTWFGTEEGLCRFGNDKKIQLYTIADGLPHNRIWNITEDSLGNIWLGTYGGICIYDGSKFTSCSNKDGLHNNIIYSVFLDSKKNIWIGTDIGIYSCDLSKKWDKHTSLFNKLYYYTNGLKQGYRIRTTYEDRKGNMWFGTREDGVIRFDGRAFTVYSVKDGLPNNTVLSITEDPQNNLWFATYGGGISKLIDRNGKAGFVSLDSRNGLPDDNAASLLIDKYGSMWVGTTKGLSKFDVNRFNKNGEVRFRNFGKENGFTGMECSQNAGFKDHEGHLWEGTVKGAFRIDPSKEVLDTIPPITHITKLNLFFRDIEWGKYTDTNQTDAFTIPENVAFPNDQNHLTFYYTGLSFSAPEKVMYQFKLEGLDKEWSPPTHETHATYSKIPSGTYTFMVKSCNNDGIWNSSPTIYRFSIAAPFWERPWFIMLSLTVLLGFVYGYIRWRERSLIAERTILEEKVQLRTQQLRSEKEKVDLAHKDIKDSINYAKRIQQSILPKIEFIEDLFDDYFIFYLPKDIVSGDFYWASNKNGRKIITAVDCTGHGVPGAFMSMLGSSLLNEIINEKNITAPAEVLNQMKIGLMRNFQQTGSDGDTKDGMDIALCAIDGDQLEVAGANNPVYIIRSTGDKKELIEIKGDKQPIGVSAANSQSFRSHSLKLQKGDCIYIFTDGFADQFGGPENKKFRTGRLHELLLSVHEKSMPVQKQIINDTFSKWQGDADQIDDVLGIGIRV